jgi:citrate lyase subunit beta/citryl-CoA lyase
VSAQPGDGGRPLRSRRSELATPASSERMCEKAPGSGADLVFLDLEDACAPAAKVGARATAVAALTELDWGRTVRAVRVNGLETPWCHGDVIEVVTGARDALDVLIVPKARSARDVWWFDVLLTQLESTLGLERRIGLEVLIEDAEGLANAAEIARASDRIEALIFGAGDLSASLHARVDGNFDPAGDYPGDFWHFARAQVVMAARTAGVDAIDAPYPAYQDPDGYRRSAVHGSLLGFDGKWAIHPSQIPIANEVFSPTPEEVAEARSAVADYRAAEAGGVGAIGRAGRLVDAAHMRLAANVLHKAALTGDGDDGTDEADGTDGDDGADDGKGTP